MPNIFSFFKGEFITAVELGEKKPTLTISHVKAVKLEDDKGKMKNRPVVFFSETDRGLVLCRTNALCLAAMFGEETDSWPGKKVTIHSEMVQVGPERKPGVRLSGSPNLTAPVKVQVKLPRRKAFVVTLTPTGKSATPVPAPETTQETTTA